MNSLTRLRVVAVFCLPISSCSREPYSGWASPDELAPGRQQPHDDGLTQVLITAHGADVERRLLSGEHAAALGAHLVDGAAAPSAAA